jgi:hypothetical protein
MLEESRTAPCRSSQIHSSDKEVGVQYRPNTLDDVVQPLDRLVSLFL